MLCRSCNCEFSKLFTHTLWHLLWGTGFALFKVLYLWQHNYHQAHCGSPTQTKCLNGGRKSGDLSSKWMPLLKTNSIRRGELWDFEILGVLQNVNKCFIKCYCKNALYRDIQWWTFLLEKPLFLIGECLKTSRQLFCLFLEG